MIRPPIRATCRSLPRFTLSLTLSPASLRAFSALRHLRKDSRIEGIGRVIKDDYAAIRENYGI